MNGEGQVQDGRPAARPLAFLVELRQRHLFRVAAAYGVVAWLLVQIVATVSPAFGLPPWVLRMVILTTIAGFLATMGVLLFRPRRESGNPLPVYLSPRARLIMAAAMVLIAILTAALSVRSLTAREPVILAVLPFADLSPARNKGYLAEGVAEEILTTLGRSPQLKVLGRSSASALQARAHDPAKIRSALGVTHILEGSVRVAEPALRLSVRLIRTDDGSQEWAEDYEGRSEDVFALQDKVANAVAARLGGAATVEEASEAEITTADAYNLYLAARQIARTRTEPELRRAYALARKVVNGQPNFAPGHALLAELTWQLSDDSESYGTIPRDKARRISLVHARKAIDLAPAAADGYAALGVITRGEAGIRALRRAMALDPARSELPLWIGLQLDELNRYQEALRYIERAAAVDPLWPAAVSRFAIDLNTAGYVEQANIVIDKFEARGGDKSQVARFRAAAAHLSGDLSETARWGATALRLNSKLPYVPSYLQRAHGLLGVRAPVPLDTKTQMLRKLFYDEGFDSVVAAVPLSVDLWSKPDFDFLVFAAGAKRDWPRLVALYDLAPGAANELCRDTRDMGATFVAALRATGRSAEADRLLSCLSAEAERIQYAGPRRIKAIAEAEIAALGGHSGRAFDMLENGLRFGWRGKSARLTDMPALDALAGHQRYSSLQRRLNDWLARERRETIATRSH